MLESWHIIYEFYSGVFRPLARACLDVLISIVYQILAKFLEMFIVLYETCQTFLRMLKKRVISGLTMLSGRVHQLFTWVSRAVLRSTTTFKRLFISLARQVEAQVHSCIQEVRAISHSYLLPSYHYLKQGAVRVWCSIKRWSHVMYQHFSRGCAVTYNQLQRFYRSIASPLMALISAHIAGNI